MILFVNMMAKVHKVMHLNNSAFRKLQESVLKTVVLQFQAQLQLHVSFAVTGYFVVACTDGGSVQIDGLSELGQ